MSDETNRLLFQQFKVFCVPLLEHSLITPSSVPRVLSLLSDVQNLLRRVKDDQQTLPHQLISYIMFPLTSILQRNTPSSIPDRIVEQVLLIISTLCEIWWWDCSQKSWEQLFMFCGAIVSGLESKDAGRTRDDETKEAAVRCIVSLTRERSPEEDPSGTTEDSGRAQAVLSRFQAHAQSPKFIPILGQTIDSLLRTCASPHLPLQTQSLTALCILIRSYIPDGFAPSILPGVVSSMTRIALGTSSAKGWSNGAVVAEALAVMREEMVKAIGDDVCLKDGAVRDITDLEDLARSPDEFQTPKTPAPYSTTRTPIWLRGTSSQLLIALNTLTPLVSHSSPLALDALCTFSASILETAQLTLPQAQPLLLSFLLSLTHCPYDSVSNHARDSLLRLLSPSSKVQQSLSYALLQSASDNLAALPRLLLSQSDARIDHVTHQIEAICLLAIHRNDETSANPSLSAVSTGIGKLLGPMGGIEKWGWRLLSVLEFETPSFAAAGTSATQLILENDAASAELVHFPDMTLKNVFSHSTQTSIARVFRALGAAGGEDCLFSVEWLVSVGRSRRDSKGVAALWCACRILEGLAGITLDTGELRSASLPRLRRAEKVARGIARSIAELWDPLLAEDTPLPSAEEEHADAEPVPEHIKGLLALDPSLKVGRVGARPPGQPRNLQPQLHQAVCLQLLSVTAGVLQARFTPLLIHTLYPVLHCVVSPLPHVATSGLAALSFVTLCTSYASPANLLLSNFDYALDAISRRLSRQWLDVDALKVLLVLVRLVGHDVVQKAGDVVEECFDRLDEYHGYEIVVEGLVEVLGEVVKVVGEDDDSHVVHEDDPGANIAPPPDADRLPALMDWYNSRHDTADEAPHDPLEYGPAPHRAWGEPPSAEEPTDTPAPATDPTAEVPPTPSQALTKQIVARSLYFLTHSSPTIRARILTLLSSAVPLLPESALLPAIHHAWPFILNRLRDPAPYVVRAAAALVEALAAHVGPFMARRVWDDVWPRFRVLLQALRAADAESALARRSGSGAGAGAGVGTESAYTHSHRLYRSMLRTMTVAVRNVQAQEAATWELLLAFRRFLSRHAHEELQAGARELYCAVAERNPDVVWLVLYGTAGVVDDTVAWMREDKWDIADNVGVIQDTAVH